jgi:hypothetical protein
MDVPVTYTDREGTTFGEINIPVKHSEGEDETQVQKMNEDFLDRHTEDLLTRIQVWRLLKKRKILFTTKELNSRCKAYLQNK